MNKITEEQMKEAFYRTLLLSDKMEELEGIVSGMGAPLGITDDNGKTVPEKLNALIAGLMESFRHYLELEGRELKKWEERMYSSFLYCAMQMTLEKQNRRDPSMSFSYMPDTFGDIINAAKDVGPDQGCVKSYCDFLKLVYYPKFGRIRNPLYGISHVRRTIVDGVEKNIQVDGKDAPYDSDFDDRMSRFSSSIMIDLMPSNYYLEPLVFSPPGDIIKSLCDEYFEAHDLSDECKERIYEMAYDPAGFYNWYIQMCWREEDELREWEEEFEYDLKAGDPEALKIQKEREERQRVFEALRSLDDLSLYKENEVLREYTQEQIMGFMQEIVARSNRSEKDRDKFVASDSELKKHFVDFLQLYYDHDHKNFYSDVVNMVRAYLIENRISPFALGDDYALVMYQVEKAQKRIAAEIERVKNKNEAV